MGKFTVVIEETIVDEFEVEAADFGEALDIAVKKYRKGEFVLSPGNVQFKQMAIKNLANETTEWTEF